MIPSELDGPVRVGWRRGEDPGSLLSREWLVTNGLGGYASGTLGGVCTRRFHSLLVAALPTPLGRVTFVSHLTESLVPSAGGPVIRLAGDHVAGEQYLLPDLEWLTEVRLESGLPVWKFERNGIVFERRVLMPHLQNTTYVTYTLLHAPGPLHLMVRPEFQIRHHEGRLDEHRRVSPLLLHDGRCELSTPELPTFRMKVHAREQRFDPAEEESKVRTYFYEERRGYDCQGPLYSSGHYAIALNPQESASICLTTESWEMLGALAPEEVLSSEAERRHRLLHRAHKGARASSIGKELVLAADQFITQPQARTVDTARAQAAGDDARTVIAGYPWFTDWGRDTMISLEGLALVTGRHTEAGYILRTFAQYVRDGLLPNLFPEGESQGLYHTADATLWFFHALERYLRTTGDRDTVRLLLPVMIDIIDHHVRGTRFGIGVDPVDGLLTQGAPGYQLTWMDAKVDDWVVTPRRGKAVEINALFFNALKLLEFWVREEDGETGARKYAELAEQTRASFNRRFWYEGGKYLYDVIDGERPFDTSLRPNQVFAISLDHPVLDRERWTDVVSVVREHLWTPMGLRSLAPGQPDYKSRYDGDLRARDAAYHQGTVWAWLIGPFVDAWRRTYPNDAESVKLFIGHFGDHLGEACIGTVSEIFDAETPYTPRGCFAQAWSVAEWLRSIVPPGE